VIKNTSINQVQGCRPGIQGPLRLCTIVPWPLHLRCRPSYSPRASLFLQRLPRSASGSPLHSWQPSIFGCWLPCLELPATGGYVGAISDNLPHSTQNVSVHLSHILAFGSFDMFVSTHCLQWTYQCFKCFWPLSKIKKFMID